MIKGFESLQLYPYTCPAGVLTVGWGHTGKDVVPFKKITEAEAEAMFSADVSPVEKAVSSLVKVPLTQNQFDALVSLVFNIGRNAFRLSKLLKALNTGDYAGAARRFDSWVYANKTVLSGLVTRRAKEKKLFLTTEE